MQILGVMGVPGGCSPALASCALRSSSRWEGRGISYHRPSAFLALVVWIPHGTSLSCPGYTGVVALEKGPTPRTRGSPHVSHQNTSDALVCSGGQAAALMYVL